MRQPGLGPFPFPKVSDPRATARVQTFAGTCTAGVSAQATLVRTQALAGTSGASASAAGRLSRTRALAGATSAVVSLVGGFVRNKILAAAITVGVSGAANLRRTRNFAGASAATATPAGTLNLNRAQNVVVDFTYQDAQVSEVSMADVGLKPEYFRSNESRALYNRLILNGSPVDMSTWTIELWWNGSAQKTITTASLATTQGQIQNQTTNLGQFFFVLLATDLATLLGSNIQVTVQMRIRFVTPDTTPPRVFSNVYFPAVISAP